MRQGFIIRKDAELAAWSGGLQPGHFLVEGETGLTGFLVGEPAGHLREDGAVEAKAFGLPWDDGRGARYGQDAMEAAAHMLRVGL
jgi:hypothetical protein